MHWEMLSMLSSCWNILVFNESDDVMSDTSGASTGCVSTGCFGSGTVTLVVAAEMTGNGFSGSGSATFLSSSS